MSIMPGIENLAPERTETSSGLSFDPKLRFAVFSSLFRCSSISLSTAGGTLPLVAMYARHASVEIVNPGGTGRPALVISARPEPLPPSTIAHRAIAVRLAVAEEIHEALGLARRLPGVRRHDSLGLRSDDF